MVLCVEGFHEKLLAGRQKEGKVKLIVLLSAGTGRINIISVFRIVMDLETKLQN